MHESASIVPDTAVCTRKRSSAISLSMLKHTDPDLALFCLFSVFSYSYTVSILMGVNEKELSKITGNILM